MKVLIVTADDFGLSVPINEAVELAHRNGILSAASLMVGAPAMADAIERARRLPTLGVGLHLVLVGGTPVLPPNQIPGLIGSDGRFHDDPICLGVRLFLSRRLQHEAEAEICAQFERFRSTGLPLDHVNGHQHFHMHPSITRIIARRAPEYCSPPVRIPLEPFGPAYHVTADRSLQRFGSWLLHLIRAWDMRRHLSHAGLMVNDFIFGVNDTGAMTEHRLLQLLDDLPDGISELYCHPATRRWEGVDNLPPDYLAVQELAALLSPVVKAKIEAIGVPIRSCRAAMCD